MLLQSLNKLVTSDSLNTLTGVTAGTTTATVVTQDPTITIMNLTVGLLTIVLQIINVLKKKKHA